MVFGHKFHGVAHNLVLGPLFGVVFSSTRTASGIAHLGAAAFNRVCVLRANQHGPVLVAAPRATADRAFILVYLFLSLTGSIGTAIYLAYHRERLR